MPSEDHRVRTLRENVHGMIQVLALGLAFLTGFVPMWIRAGRLADERDSTRRALRLVRLEALIAAGTVDARRGRYDWARQSIDHWFVALRDEIESESHSCLSPSQQASLEPMLELQEELISALRRREASSVVRLTTVYLQCRKAIRGG